MKIEKIPSLICENCGSCYIMKTDEGFECDECNRITAQTSDLLEEENSKLKLTFKNLERINEVI